MNTVKIKDHTITILETPRGVGKGKDKERKYLLLVEVKNADGTFSRVGVYAAKDELQKLNEAITQIISSE